MAPGLVGGAVIPLCVYFAVRSHVGGDAHALMIAGAPAALWVGIEWARRRRIDPIGIIVLFGFATGIVASVLLGGNAFVLKIRDTVFTSMFGVVCLISLTWRKPMMFFIGRALSAGDDPEKIQAYEALWDMPTAPRTFRIITAVWGVGLIAEACARILLAAALSTGVFLAVAPVWAGAAIGGMFVFTVRYSKRARRLAEAQYADAGIQYPSVSLERAQWEAGVEPEF
jgi:hypothetical protein